MLCDHQAAKSSTQSPHRQESTVLTGYTFAIHSLLSAGLGLTKYLRFLGRANLVIAFLRLLLVRILQASSYSLSFSKQQKKNDNVVWNTQVQHTINSEALCANWRTKDEFRMISFGHQTPFCLLQVVDDYQIVRNIYISAGWKEKQV